MQLLLCYKHTMNSKEKNKQYRCQRTDVRKLAACVLIRLQSFIRTAQLCEETNDENEQKILFNTVWIFLNWNISAFTGIQHDASPCVLQICLRPVYLCLYMFIFVLRPWYRNNMQCFLFSPTLSDIWGNKNTFPLIGLLLSFVRLLTS